MFIIETLYYQNKTISYRSTLFLKLTKIIKRIRKYKLVYKRTIISVISKANAGKPFASYF